jgi:hypothetical protein
VRSPLCFDEPMRRLSSADAARMGRLAGAARVGDRDWGQRMLRQRGARTQKRCYPSLWPLWLENARRTKAGRPLLPVPVVNTPTAIATREARRRRQLQAEGAYIQRA